MKYLIDTVVSKVLSIFCCIFLLFGANFVLAEEFVPLQYYEEEPVRQMRAFSNSISNPVDDGDFAHYHGIFNEDECAIRAAITYNQTEIIRSYIGVPKNLPTMDDTHLQEILSKMYQYDIEGALEIFDNNSVFSCSDTHRYDELFADISDFFKRRAPKDSVKQLEEQAKFDQAAKKFLDENIGSFRNEKSLADTLKNIGSKHKGAGNEVRTVSRSEFNQLKNELLQGATKMPKDSNYSGTWYQLPNSQGQVGVRQSVRSGETLDFRGVNGLPKNFKIHQK